MAKRKMFFNITHDLLRAVKISRNGGGTYKTELLDKHGRVRDLENCETYKDALSAAQDMMSTVECW